MNSDKMKKYLKEFKTIFILVVVALTVKSSLIEIYVVPTGSMEDEILVGDLMIGNKFTYGMRTPDWIGIPYTRMGFYIPSLRLPKFKNIENGDVAMFEFPRDPFQKYVKRCIGIASDTIEIKKGDIYINDNKMPFPPKAKYITFSEGDLDGDGSILDTLPDGRIFYDRGDLALRNSKNEMRFNVAFNKINFLNNKNADKYDLFNKRDIILFNSNYQLNPYKEEYLYKSNEQIASIQSQYVNNQIYPYFSGNNDNMSPFIVPYRGMEITINDWFDDKNEWISFLTLLVQDKNEVMLGDVKFIMEDPESIAQISGILWYKIFPNNEKRINNYHHKKGLLKSENKTKKVDNPWYIYENPILMQFSNSKLHKSVDLNQDQILDSYDLVNSAIWDSFILDYNPNKLLDIIDNKYNGNQLLFALEFYKEYADSYIKENLKINGSSISELETYTVKNNYYMFVGDNRDNSYDSRIWGFVPEYQLLGTPLLSLVNITKFKLRLKTIN